MRGTTAICVLSGVLGIAACGAQPNNPGEELEQTSAALTAARPLARGVVRDGTGTPLARARVDVRAAGGYRILACETTAADGSFALDVRAGSYDITVTPKTGFAPQLFPGQVIARGTTLHLVFTAENIVDLNGQVTDQNGQPMSGIGVCGLGCSFTDATGAFAVSVLAGQSLSISGRFGSGEFEVQRPIAPTQTSPLDVVIPIFTLTGTVIDPTGAPVTTLVTIPPCGTVDIEGMTGTFCNFDMLETDAAGRFQTTTLPGDVTIQVSGNLGAWVTESVTADTDVTIQLPPLQSLSGRITDRDGNGLSGEAICAIHSTCHSHFCWDPCAITDSSGLYQFNLSSGVYDVSVFNAAGSAASFPSFDFTQTITLSQATEADFNFQNRMVTGTVLAADGTPAANVTVSAGCQSFSLDGFTGGACARQQTTDETGRFQLTLAAPGDVVLVATGEGTVATLPLTVTGDADVVIQLSTPQPASGQVLASDGSPVAGASVCYTPPTEVIGTCTTTDAGGQYQLTLPPGTYALSAEASSPGIRSFSITQSITVPSAPTTLQLAATQAVSLRLVNGDGTPHAGAAIQPDCVTVPVAGISETVCGLAQTSDASGGATITTAAGAPLGLEIAPGAGLPSVAVSQIDISNPIELTITLQSSTTSP